MPLQFFGTPNTRKEATRILDSIRLYDICTMKWRFFEYHGIPSEENETKHRLIARVVYCLQRSVSSSFPVLRRY